MFSPRLPPLTRLRHHSVDSDEYETITRFTRKDPRLPRGPIKLPPLKPDKVSRRDRSESPRRTISSRSPLKTRLTFNENETKLVVRQREDKDGGGKGRRARDDGYSNAIMEQLDYRPGVLCSVVPSMTMMQFRFSTLEVTEYTYVTYSRQHADLCNMQFCLAFKGVDISTVLISDAKKLNG